MLKRNNWHVGIIVGLTGPAILYLLLYLMDLAISNFFGINITRQHHLLYLLSVVANVWPIRHYLIKLKYEKAGFGVLIATGALILIYFYLFYQPS